MEKTIEERVVEILKSKNIDAYVMNRGDCINIPIDQYAFLIVGAINETWCGDLHTEHNCLESFCTDVDNESDDHEAVAASIIDVINNIRRDGSYVIFFPGVSEQLGEGSYLCSTANMYEQTEVFTSQPDLIYKFGSKEIAEAFIETWGFQLSNYSIIKDPTV